MDRRVWSGFGLDGVDGTSTWVLFRPYLANRCPDRSRLFCAGKPSFTPFFRLPELAERSTIGCASPNSTWHGQNEHISSVLGGNSVDFFGLWLVLKPRVIRVWEALIRVKRTGGSCATAKSLQKSIAPSLSSYPTRIGRSIARFKRRNCTFSTHLLASITDRNSACRTHFAPDLQDCSLVMLVAYTSRSFSARSLSLASIFGLF